MSYIEVSSNLIGDLTVQNGGSLNLQELNANGSDIVSLKAPDSLAASYTLEFPEDDGTNAQVLSTNGSGVLSWQTNAATTSWGAILGTLSNQTDLQAALDAKASTALSNLASLAINTSLLAGSDNAIDLGSTTKNWRSLYISTSIKNGATTLATAAELGYLTGVTSAIQTQLNAKAPTASPTFTGTVTIPTPFTLGATSVTTDGTELNYVDGVTSSIQTQIDSKKTISTGNNYRFETTGAGGLLQETAVTASRAVATDSNGLPTASATTDTELGYVNGVTSAIQTQINTKKTSSTGTNYAFETTGVAGVLQETTVTASRAVVTDANGLPSASATTATEISYVNGVTSAIQTQIATKSSFPIGTMLQMPSAPTGNGTWLACDGSSVSQSTYATLFSAVGHQYLKYQSTVSATSMTITNAGPGPAFYAGSGKWWMPVGAANGYYSSDNGSTWTAANRGGNTSNNAIATNGAGTIIAIRSASTTYDISTDGGATWGTATGVLSDSSPFVSWNGTHFLNSGNASRSVLYSTTGADSSWTTTANAKSAANTTMTSTFLWLNSNWFYMSSVGNGSYTSDSTGATGWTDINMQNNFGQAGGVATNGTNTVAMNSEYPPATITDITNPLSGKYVSTFFPSTPVAYADINNSGWPGMFWNGKHYILVSCMSGSTSYTIYTSLNGTEWYSRGYTGALYFGNMASPSGSYKNGRWTDTTNFRIVLNKRLLTTTTAAAVIIDPSIDTTTNFNVPDAVGYWVRAL